MWQVPLVSDATQGVGAFGKPPKKKVKKLHTKCELWGGGGQQILVCEPQKSAFFKANFPKKKTCCN